MDLNLNGKVAIVTGGSQGIGRAISLRLAEEGCRVVIAARSRGPIDETVKAITDTGGEALGISVDVGNKDDIQRMVDEAVARFGTVHVLVNNVGGQNEPFRFDEIEDEHWYQAFEINVMAVVRAVRAVLPHMRAQGWGRIINISSVAATQPEPVFPHYNAAKAALNNFTKSLSRLAGADGILVNSVSPGLVRTPGFDEQLGAGAKERGLTLDEAERQFVKKLRPGIVTGRAGHPEEVAAVVALLASDLAGFVAGANYRVDGGSILSV
jgi:NAD(P)-dependent dehydrogenase (short-subunit alcohol dehydrogenase family)